MLPIIHCEPALRDDITVMLDEAAELETATEQYYLALRQTQGAIHTDRLDWRPQGPARLAAPLGLLCRSLF